MAKRISLILTVIAITGVPTFIQAWTRVYGPGQESGICVQKTLDGGYVVLGRTSSFGNGKGDAWLLKTDSNGDTLWSRTYGGEEMDEGKCVRQTSDEGYIITGVTSSFGVAEFDMDLWMVKTDSVGDTLWTRIYRGEQTGDFKWDAGWCVEQTSDDGYIVIGDNRSFSSIGHFLWLLKLDSMGDTLWTRLYSGSSEGAGYSIQQTSDGGYIATGQIKDTLGSMLWLLKFDSLGDTLWTKYYGLGVNDMGYSVRQTSDGDYVIAGQYSPSWSQSHIWLLKTDSLGDTLWTRLFGGERLDAGYSVDEVLDGGYVVTGEANVDLWLIKTDVNGNTEWIREFGETLGDRGSSVEATSDGGFIVTGHKDYISFVTSGYLWLIKTDSLGYAAITEPATPPTHTNWHITQSVGHQIVLRYADSPQGFHADIFNAAGRKVDELHAPLPFGTISWGQGYSPGVYFIRVEGDASHITQKVVLVR